MGALSTIRDLIVPTPLERAEKEHNAALAELATASSAYGDEPTTAHGRAYTAARDRADLARVVLERAKRKAADEDAKRRAVEEADRQAEIAALEAKHDYLPRMAEMVPLRTELVEGILAIADVIRRLDAADRETQVAAHRVRELGGELRGSLASSLTGRITRNTVLREARDAVRLDPRCLTAEPAVQSAIVELSRALADV